MATESSARFLKRRAGTDVAVAQPPSIGRLAFRRLAKHRAIAVAQLIAMTLAAALPIALYLVSTSAADQGYRTAIQPGTTDSLVTVEASGIENPLAFNSLQSDVGRTVSSTFGPALLAVASYGRLGPFTSVSLNGRPYSIAPSLMMAAFFPGLEREGSLVAGAWAKPPTAQLEATMSAEGATRLGLKPGDRLCVLPTAAPASNEGCFTLTGTWQRSSKSSFWLAGPGSLDVTFDSDSYWRLQQLTVGARSVGGIVYSPNPDQQAAEGARPLHDGIARLKGYYQVSRGIAVLTTLDLAIDRFLQEEGQSRYLVQLVAVEIVLIGLCGLGFATLSYLGTQHQMATLLRTRGWTRQRLSLFLGAQFLILAVPAALASVVAALAFVVAAGGGVRAVSGPSARGLIVAGIADLTVLAFCLVLAARFAWHPLNRIRASAARRGMPPFWRWRNTDLVAAVIAVPVLLEASLRGQTAVRSAGGGSDLVGLLLPALGLGLLSLAGLRLLEAAAIPLAAFKRSVPARLAGWRLGRRGHEHAGVALVLTLALAVGVFAAIYESTVVRGAVDRADYYAGSDVRIAFTGAGGADAVREALARLGSPPRRAALLRAQISTRNTSDSMIAIAANGDDFRRAAWSRSDVSAVAIAAELDRLAGSPPAMRLPGQPDALTLRVKSAATSGTLSALVKDAGGQTCTCKFGDLAATGLRTLEAKIAFPSTPRYPLQLTGIRVDGLAGPPAELDLMSLKSVESGASVQLDSLASSTGWWATGSDGLAFAPLESAVNGTAVSLPSTGSVTLYPPYLTHELPVLMDRATMTRLGILPGFEVPVVYDLHSLNVKVVGAVDGVPTLYPGSDAYVVMPLGPALSALAAASGEAVTPNEVWIKAGKEVQQRAQAVGPSVNVSYTLTSGSQEQVALADPVLIELRANLLIGFVSAFALAVLGFAVHFLITSRRRLAEHAILEANGLDRSEIRASISIEQAAVVLVAVAWGSVVAGVAIGVLLPSLQIGTSAETMTPPALITISWVALAVSAGVVAAVTTAVAWLTRTVGASVNVVDELRRLG